VQEVPATMEVPTIEARRTRAEYSARAGAQSEEEEGDGTVGGHLGAATQLAHKWVGVSSRPFSCLFDFVVIVVVS